MQIMGASGLLSGPVLDLINMKLSDAAVHCNINEKFALFL